MRKAGDIITALFRDRFGPEFMEEARSSAGLFSSWTKIVAEAWPCQNNEEKDDVPAAAVHSRIKELELGILLVEADHPGWVQILQTRQGELLAAAQRRYPDLDIRGIAFKLSRELIFTPTPEEKKAPVNPCSGEKAEEEFSAAASQDKDFYSALKGLEESIKKRNG